MVSFSKGREKSSWFIVCVMFHSTRASKRLFLHFSLIYIIFCLFFVFSTLQNIFFLNLNLPLQLKHRSFAPFNGQTIFLTSFFIKYNVELVYMLLELLSRYDMAFIVQFSTVIVHANNNMKCTLNKMQSIRSKQINHTTRRKNNVENVTTIGIDSQ